jgi:phytoene dehydrogenase-like protein
MASPTYDVIVVGGGHNGLTAAAYLAAAGRAVLVLERDTCVGGAARSAAVFPGHAARLSKYAYLVSLLPQQIIDELGLDVTLVRRRISSYTPVGAGGILIDDGDPGRTAAALGEDAGPWSELAELTSQLAERVFPTLTEPLRARDDLRRHVGAGEAWDAVFERPLGELLEARFASDVVRGIVLTDGLIGTFARARDASLLANRCFLYHVIGRGTGRWDVPLGGMGSVTDALAAAARRGGAEIEVGATVTGIEPGPDDVLVRTDDGQRRRARHVVANVAPAALARLLGEPSSDPAPEGAQLKINMLLRRLPRLRDADVSPEQAFAGTLHVNESYAQLEGAYQEAASGRLPTVPPCEVYCHSLTDPSILGPELQAAGAHTLTLFGLHMPARLFRDDPPAALAAAREATLASLNSVLAEPVEDCLVDPTTIEVMGPLEIESRLGMPGGHIFHRDLQWPFAERPEEIGRWGVETRHDRVLVGGAGARRGGGVSGIPGRNAAMAILGR